MKQIINSTGLIAALCLISFLVQAQGKPEKGTIQIYLAYSQLNNDLPVIKAFSIMASVKSMPITLPFSPVCLIFHQYTNALIVFIELPIISFNRTYSYSGSAL